MCNKVRFRNNNIHIGYVLHHIKHDEVCSGSLLDKNSANNIEDLFLFHLTFFI